MKKLLIMRHAKSSWKITGIDDFDRPLNERGQLAAPRIGSLIREQGLQPDVLLCSSAKRASETADHVSQQCDCASVVQRLGELYLAAPEAYLAHLRQQTNDVELAMVVGHNPGLEQLLSLLTGAEEPLPTAALALVELDIDSWDELNQNTSGQLKSLWRPKELE